MPDEKEVLELAILNAYREKHKTRIDLFIRQNPGKALPIYKDENGNPVWMTRKQRRQRNLR